jgi:hypothetical protein
MHILVLNLIHTTLRSVFSDIKYVLKQSTQPLYYGSTLCVLYVNNTQLRPFLPRQCRFQTCPLELQK